VKILRGHEKAITSLQFSPNGTKLCSGSLDKSFRVWSVPDGAMARTVATPAEINAMIWSAGGRQIVTAHEDQLIRVWQWPTADAAMPDKELKGHEGPVTSLDTLPSPENRLLSGSTDGTLRVWDIEKGEQVREMKHGGPVTAVAARSDGKRFASAGLNRATKLWDPEKGEPVAELKGDRYAQEHAAAMERAAKFATSEVAYRKTSLQSAEGEQKKLTERLTKVTETNAIAGKAIVEKKKNLETASESKTKAEQVLTDLKVEVKKITDAYEAADKEAKLAAAEAKGTLEKALFADRIVQKDSETDKAGDDLAKAKATAEQPFSDLKAQLKKLSDALEAAEKEAKRASSEAKTAIEKAKSQERAEEPSKDDKLTADHSAKERVVTDEKAVVEKMIELVAVKSFSAGRAKAALDKITAESPEKIKQATDKLTTASNTLATAEREFKRAEVVTANTAHELELTTNSLNQATSALAKAKDALEAAETEKKNSETDLEFAKQSASRAEKPIRALAFSADNRTVATAGDDQRVHTWSAETGAAFDTYRRHTDGVFAIAFVGVESLISAAEDQSVISWDLTTDWTLERVIGTGDVNSPLVDRVNAVQFSPDGKLLATGGGEPSRGGEIKLWGVSDGTLAQDFPNVHSDAVFGLDFSADGKYLASGAADRFVKVIELATGKIAKSFEGHTHHVLGVSWKQDGRTLASCGADNAIKVWDFVTGERKKTPAGGPLENFGKEVTAIAFISGTDQAVVCSGDSQVRKVRDNGEQVRTFEGAADYVHSSAVTPDGKIVIAGGQDSILRVWDGSGGKVIAAFAPPNH
jgi:WD40 repeat protein